MSEPLDPRIPDEIVRRLDGVDEAIDRADQTRMARPPGLLVVPGRVGVRESRGAIPTAGLTLSRGMVAIVLVTVFVTAGALTAFESIGPLAPIPSQPAASAAVGAPSTSPTPTPEGSAAASSAPDASASAAASSNPSATPQPSVGIVRTPGSAIPMVQKELRASCLGKGTQPDRPPTKTFILDAVPRATGPGWLDAAQTVWYGPDVREAAAAFGARALVIGDDGEWVIVGYPGKSEARQLVGLEVGDGTAYWLATRLEAIACR